jgi:SAM-dependent methyltransferase
MSDLPEHVLRNRAFWDEKAQEFIKAGEEAWERDTPVWGIWQIPESQVQMLPDSVADKDIIELGCGTAYVSAWLARKGARVVGVDNSGAQLATARRLQRKHSLEFPLIHANAESIDYPDASFDFAISEYGACLWADPSRWLPETARLLRPGGQLAFLTSSFLLMLCMSDEDVPATERLQRPAFGLLRVEWPTDPGIEFHPSHGEWIRLMRHSGFEVEELIELRPSPEATARWHSVTLEWARQWPCEEVWKARKRS